MNDVKSRAAVVIAQLWRPHGCCTPCRHRTLSDLLASPWLRYTAMCCIIAGPFMCTDAPASAKFVCHCAPSKLVAL